MKKDVLKLSSWSRVAAIGSITLIVAAGLVACGDETTNVTETTGMSVVKKGDKTPDCTADNEGEMIYVADSAAAFFCADGKWQSLKGEKGEQGKQGEPGEPGEGKQGPKGDDGVGKQGEPGAAGKSCTAQKLASNDGYKIVCGGDSVGVVQDGLKGSNGTSCNIESVAGGVVTVKCGTGETAKTTQLYKAFCNGTVYDPDSMLCDSRDNQLYRIVTIAPTGTNYSKTWMAQNLNYAYTAPTEGNGLDSSSFCYGDNGSTNRGTANCAKYGRLYLWSAAMDSAGVIPGNVANGCGYGAAGTPGTTVRGVCPVGWHLPSQQEWNSMSAAVGTSNAGELLKSQEGWADMTDGSSGNGTDDYKFSVVPSPIKMYVNSSWTWGTSGIITNFWSTASIANDEKAIYFQFRREATILTTSVEKNIYAFSVRCIKDSE